MATRIASDTVRNGVTTCIVLLTILVTASAPALAAGSGIETALGHPDRPGADRDRDRTSRPAEVIAMADLDPGDMVLDLFGGGGYYSEIASRTVGPTGRVYLHNNAAYVSFVGPALERRLADGRLANVVDLRSEIPDLKLPTGQFDVVLMVLSWHDLYWIDDAWPEVDVDQFVAQLIASLKPDGRLVIVDHAAIAGTQIEAVGELHRIDEDHVIATLEKHGFRLSGRSQALRNSVDDRTVNVFDPGIRRQTDRFVLRFEAPLANVD